MAVSTQNSVTTLPPTSWKWFLGAAVMLFLIPPFGALVALVFALMGAGVLQRVTLTPDGLTGRNWFSTKTYAWSEIEDFRIYKVKSGLFTAANMVSFSHVDKRDTMMGKAAKLLVEGTHSIPAVGMKANTLIHLMQAYKMGHVPRDTAIASSETATETAAPVLPPAQAKTQRPRAVPATPRAHAQRSNQKASFGTKPKPATPLVQDGGGLFGRRRPDSPFGS